MAPAAVVPGNVHSLIVFATSPPALFHPRTLSTCPFDAARAPIAPGSPCTCCAIKQCCDENRLTVRPTLCAARCEPLRSLERRKESGCAPGPSLTGDRRHGRGCELRRCSGRLTSGPGAPIGASRHRPNVKISTARLLQSRASVRAACARAPATCGAPWCAKSAPLGATREQGARGRGPGATGSKGRVGVLLKRLRCHRFLCSSLCSAALDANSCSLSLSHATDSSSCFTCARARRRRRRRRRRHCRRRCCRRRHCRLCSLPRRSRRPGVELLQLGSIPSRAYSLAARSGCCCLSLSSLLVFVVAAHSDIIGKKQYRRRRPKSPLLPNEPLYVPSRWARR